MTRTRAEQRPRSPTVDPTPFWRKRSAVAGTCAGVALIAALAYAQGGWAALVYALLTDGVILALWLIAAWGIGALFPLPLRAGWGEGASSSSLSGDSVDSTRFSTAAPPRPNPLPEGEGIRLVPLRMVTAVALGLGIMSLATLGLGLAGVLNRVTAIALVGVGLAAALARVVRSREALAAQPSRVSLWSWLWLIAMPVLGLAVVGALMPPGFLWGDEPHGYDVVEYHLQVPREWYELGRIVPLEHNVFSFFPFNVELQYLLAMHLRGGPWAGMFLAQGMHVAYVALAAAAVYASARALTGCRARATVAGVAAAVVPWGALLGSVAYNEGGLLIYGALAVGWAAVALRTGAQVVRSMAVAGVMAGFACGVKLTGVPMLLVAVPVVVLAVAVVRRQRPGRFVAGSAAFVVTGLLLFSPWLVRNAIWTGGNPVFPEAQSLLGRGHFSDVQAERWSRAHSPRQDQRPVGARAEAAVRQIALDWRFGYLLLPLAVAAFAMTARRPESLAIALLLAALLVFWLALTHLQGRFFVLAIPLCATLLALPEPRVWRVVATVSVVVLGVVGLVGLSAKWSDFNRSMAKRTRGTAATDLLGFDGFDRWTMTGRDPIPPDATLVLVGDAEAFLYQVPMRQLRYRTVFDVDTSAGAGVIEAWTEGAPQDGRSVVLVDPGSLDRFARTYHGIPPLPPELRDRSEPFVLPPGAE